MRRWLKILVILGIVLLVFLIARGLTAAQLVVDEPARQVWEFRNGQKLVTEIESQDRRGDHNLTWFRYVQCGDGHKIAWPTSPMTYEQFLATRAFKPRPRSFGPSVFVEYKNGVNTTGPSCRSGR